MIPEQARRTYQENGYAVVERLFNADEVEQLIAHFMRLREQGAHPGDFSGIDPASNDPLKRYPRMIHMHHWDDVSLRWVLDARINGVLTALLGREPLAVQTMLYFKPAGARGQALHQDNFYLRAQPGTCMAAWLALDDCDEENGCMQVIPGSHQWPILCPQAADTTVSFTDVTVPVPEGHAAVPVRMRAGDVLFFNGSLVHGSFPNTSATRFRRALIGHYVDGVAEAVATFYDPVFRMDGSRVALKASPEGGPWGIWVDHDGQLAIDAQGGHLAGAGGRE